MPLSDILTLEKRQAEAYDPMKGNRAFAETLIKTVAGEIDRRRKQKETEATRKFELEKLEKIIGVREKVAEIGAESKKDVAGIKGEKSSAAKEENINKALGVLQTGFQVIGGKKIIIRDRTEAESVARNLYKSPTGTLHPKIIEQINKYPESFEEIRKSYKDKHYIEKIFKSQKDEDIAAFEEFLIPRLGGKKQVAIDENKKVGDIISKGGKNYKVVGIDTDGEPLVELAE